MTLAGTLFGVLGILFTLPILAVTKILLENKKLS
jgi:predicted PurR-regulated permease PerM